MNIDISKLYHVEFYVERDDGRRSQEEVPVLTCVFEAADLGAAETLAIETRPAVFEHFVGPPHIGDDPLEHEELICMRVTPYSDYLQHMLTAGVEVQRLSKLPKESNEEE